MRFTVIVLIWTLVIRLIMDSVSYYRQLKQSSDEFVAEIQKYVKGDKSKAISIEGFNMTSMKTLDRNEVTSYLERMDDKIKSIFIRRLIFRRILGYVFIAILTFLIMIPFILILGKVL